uniref:Tyrosine-protein kinase Dnt-like n=1 Tax=Diabrotica virgifera virgifera TaxID=50390 RepID=A0A6P7FK82_DIAVI
INAELFYVHKGVVNNYALNFVVMIPANISEIQFSWQSLMNYSLPYVIAVKYGHGSRGALLPPKMNISSTGVIPTSVQTFSVQLLCTGSKNAEIIVEIQLSVSTHKKANATTLRFRRNKICLKSEDCKPAKSSLQYGNHFSRFFHIGMDYKGFFYRMISRTNKETMSVLSLTRYLM